ncbi:hypothetical protein ONZ45_g15900 [Pleurotus djamor]|nr:hypothetical protein ONZ45_g15900 [Pleurotus djamor]
MASHRLLHLPDFLEELFQHLVEHKCDSDYALVCKDWAEVVFDYAWRETSALKLFKLLAPIVMDPTANLCCFSQPISSDGWSRFRKYHYRVRILRCTCTASGSSLHPSVYALAGLNRPYAGPFLPNLTVLDCPSDATYAQLFASPSITTFQLMGESELKTEQDYQLIVKYLPACTPNLESLRLSADRNNQYIQDALVEALPNLRFLNQLDISVELLTPQVTKIISKLPLLTSLTGHGSHPDFSEMLSLELDSECFPKLEHLRLNAWLERAEYFFKVWVSPTSLKTLSIVERNAISEPGAYQTIIGWAASNSPLLETLAVSFDDEEFEHDINVNDPLPFSIFEPLLSCKHLSSLTISYPLPFEMTEAELVRLVTALPLLCHMDIGTIDAPPSGSEPSLGLSALCSIAPLCHSLEYLCIYMSFHATDQLDDVPSPSVPFKCLNILDVGQSPIQGNISVALFLNRILPASCSLEFEEYTGSGSEDEDQDEDEDWQQVVTVLKALRITHREAKKCK